MSENTLKILIIDDEFVSSKALAMQLEVTTRFHWTVMAEYRWVDPTEQTDLILLDIMLQEVSGYDICKLWGE